MDLADLPLQITSCLEAVNDVNEFFGHFGAGEITNNPSNDASKRALHVIAANSACWTILLWTANDVAKIIGHGADCAAEAFLAAIELVRLYLLYV